MASLLQKLGAVLSSTQLFAAYQWAIGAPRCHRRFIHEFVKPSPEDRILDLGCGFGASINYLPRTAEYVGIDVSREYIAAARRCFENRGTFICSAIEDVDPNVLGSFDLAISFGVLHHLDDRGAHAMLRLVSKTVRSGGRLVTIDPCYAAKQPAVAQFLIRNDRGRFVRDREGYRKLCMEYGKTDVRMVSDMLRIPYTQAVVTLESERELLMIALSVAVPCFDEAAVLPELHRRLSAVCQQVAGSSYELVLVNDGSTDQTWPLICELALQDPHVVGVNLSRNHGHQLALTAALSYCEGERILIIDADLQDPPELLPAMMKKIDEGADVVYGQRRSRAGEGAIKRFTAAAFYRLLERLTDVPIPPDTGDFRLVTRRILRVLQDMPEQHRFIRGMVSWIGFRQVPILYDREPRFAGRTGYPFRRMVSFAFDAITSFSVRPLRVALYLGSTMCAAAAFLIVLAIVWWFVFKPFAGWTSLMVVVLAIGGVQTFILGLIGEYVSRLYLQAKGRPLYVVSDVISIGRSESSQFRSASAGDHFSRE